MNRLFPLVALTLLSGCPSPAMNLTRARSAGPGAIEVLPFVAVVAGKAERADREGVIEGFGLDGGVGARFGLTEWLELGLMASAAEAGYVRFDTKLTFVDTPDFAMAVAPGVASHIQLSLDGDPAVELRAPLLVDVELGRGIALVLGPSYLANLYVAPNGDTTWEHWVGASIGVDIPFGKGVRLLPEVSMPFPLDSRWDAIAVTIAFAPVIEL
ncbi:MAG: hypothetical protein AMXMBFR64_00570 [Myxococcales bacterium]